MVTIYERATSSNVQAVMWGEGGKTSLARSFTGPIFGARVRTTAADQDGVALATALTQLEGQDFVCEPDFTLTDIVIGHVLYRYYHIDIPRENHPNIARNYARLCTRPAYRNHVLISCETLIPKDMGCRRNT